MRRAQERLRLRAWLSSASPWTVARRSPTFRRRPRRRRRAAPRPVDSPATSICAIHHHGGAGAGCATRRIKIALMAMSPVRCIRCSSPRRRRRSTRCIRPHHPLPGRRRARRSQGSGPGGDQAAGRDRRAGEDLLRALLAGEMARISRAGCSGSPGRRLATADAPASAQKCRSCWRRRRPHAEARRTRERRRAYLGRDLAALREGPLALPRRQAPVQLPQGRYRLYQLSATEKEGIDPIRRLIGFVRAAPIAPRTSACRAPSSTRRALSLGLCIRRTGPRSIAW